jgi:hypothetical protein
MTLAHASRHDTRIGVLTAHGRFTRSPFAGELYPAGLGVLPLLRPEEFEQGHAFEHINPFPVLLSPRQRFDLLAKIVTAARETIPDLSAAIVNANPGNYLVQLPAELLNPDVFLINDPAGLAAPCVAAGHRNVLTVVQQLRADSVELGDNSLELRLYNPDGPEAFEAFLRHPVFGGCHDLRLVESLPNAGPPPSAKAAAPLRHMLARPKLALPEETDFAPAILRRALHWRIEAPYLPDTRDLADRAGVLAQCVGAQVEAVARGVDPADCVHTFSSTHLSWIIGDIPAHTTQFLDTIEARGGQRPIGVTRVYECSGWGYLLQFISRFMHRRYVVLSIVDIDLHGFGYWDYHHAIGHSGYGLTALLIELPERPLAVYCDGPYQASAFPQFIRDLRARRAAGDVSRAFLPFFKPDLQKVAAASLDPTTTGGNHHDVFGHAFGSDPWIGMIKHLQDRPPSAPERVIAGSIAISGYYSICDIELGPDTEIGLITGDGRRETLMARAAAYPDYGAPGLEARR